MVFSGNIYRVMKSSAWIPTQDRILTGLGLPTFTPQSLQGDSSVKHPKAKRAPNQEQILDDDLLRKLMDLLSLYQGMIRITIRCLPLQFSPKAREQRMGRLLHNPLGRETRLGERIDFHYPF